MFMKIALDLFGGLNVAHQEKESIYQHKTISMRFLVNVAQGATN
jgi:hypothetical protein